MSITPIERDEDRSSRDRSGEENAVGVPQLVVLLVRTLLWRVRRLTASALGTASGPEADEDSEDEPRLRVSGQRRLTDGRAERGQRQQRPLPEGPELRSEQTEESMRVYDPADEEAFITSDTWEDVQQ